MLRLRQSRRVTRHALYAFVWAVTLLPYLHTVGHRNDHLHVGGALVRLDDSLAAHNHPHPHPHTSQALGFPARAPMACIQVASSTDETPDPTHGEGAIEHCAVAALPGAIVIFPEPARPLEPLPQLCNPAAPVPVACDSPRLTRGPPLS